MSRGVDTASLNFETILQIYTGYYASIPRLPIYPLVRSSIVSIGVLTADVLGGDDLQVKVVGVDALPVAGFNPAVDVIG